MKPQPLLDHPSRNALPDIAEHIPALRRYARFLAAGQMDADDLVQECLTRAVTHIGSWQPGTNLRAWLFVILKNAFRNQRRKKRYETHRHSLLIDEPSQPSMMAPSQPASVRLAEVGRALLDLSPEHREILLLVTVEGMAYEQAAEILNISVGTVKSRLSRARTALRQRLEGEQE